MTNPAGDFLDFAGASAADPIFPSETSGSCFASESGNAGKQNLAPFCLATP